MNDGCSAIIDYFGGYCFERYTLFEKDTGLTHCCYAIDGAEVSQEEWTQKREEATALDRAKLNRDNKN